jgi:uncharacterized protein (DUF58 family)
MQAVNSIQQQLAMMHADGVHLGTRELLFYQTHGKLLELSPSKQVKAHLSGGYVSAIKGRGMEFDEARHYQPGDDIRAIDWRVTARTGKTHTKVYREERERPVFILCDFSHSMVFGSQLLFKSVQAAHLASLVGWSAVDRGDKVGAIVFNDNEHIEIKPKSRKRAALSLFHGLTSIHSQATPKSIGNNKQALEQSLMRLRRLVRPGSLVYLISDFDSFNETCAKYVSDIRRHCEVKAAHIFDPIEYALPAKAQGRILNIKSAVSDQTLTLGTASSRNAYTKQQEQKRNAMYTLLSPHIDSYLSINAGKLLIDQLQPGHGGTS